MYRSSKVTALILALVLLFCTVSLSACQYLADPDAAIGGTSEKTGTNADTLTREQIDAMVRELVEEATAGADHNISITANGDASLYGASHALLSSVSIICRFSAMNGSASAKSGSGVIYRLDKEAGDAYIVTNYHVVYDRAANTANSISDQINVYLYGKKVTGGEMRATFIGGSMTYDLAVLKITDSDVLRKSQARAVKIADSDELCVLDRVIAIGDAEGLGISATPGFINMESEYVDILASDDVTPLEMRLMRIDASVNSGNSGGGLFNERGELVGIVNAKRSDTTIEGIGYAIPSNVVRNLTENILDHYNGQTDAQVHRPLLGMTVQTADSNAVYITDENDPMVGRTRIVETITVSEISRTGATYGKIKVGDRITALTLRTASGETVTKQITRLYQIIDTMFAARVGDTAVFSVVRGGVSTTVEVPITSSMIRLCD